MGTKFSDYLAESMAADTPEDTALRQAYAASLDLSLQEHDARAARPENQPGPGQQPPCQPTRTPPPASGGN